MAKPDSPAQKAARDFLLGLVSESRRRGRLRLPTVKELAAHAGVSLVTMWKAVNEQKAKGILTAWRGRGIHIRLDQDDGAGEAAVSFDRMKGAPKQKWERLCERIKADIHKGVFPARERSARLERADGTLRGIVPDNPEGF